MIVMEAFGRGAGAGAVSRDRRARRRLPAPRRLGRSRRPLHSRHHRRQQDACLRACWSGSRATTCGRLDRGQEEGRRLGARRREERRAARRRRRHAGRHRAHRAASATATASALFLVPRQRRAWSRRAIRPRTACAPPRSRFTGVEVGADAAIGEPGTRLPLIERVVDEARIALCAEAVGAMDER